ncbi:hypothetical protein DFJ58DRAFT_732166 [Suillus subalutaceus]|uniref:uncharacterized protein n=1 Tax=Suillus subalutaceus TaxID=48586 RepID=UPI001B85DED8|nr:uncharacterized protein DFJ58DRAFT_732166 [Suillus subalutaceus]KAG1842177.1 hypothetical protein DFJ58DRAFT_732166 [Suillus subalutaceus]
MTTPMQLESLKVSDTVSYYYFDSGDIPGNTYTTLVFIPGMGFNGGVFRKLFPLAAAHRIRIVSLYRRDYNPTTSFRDADLAGLVSRTVEGQEGFLRSQAVDIATFLVMFAREQHIPLAEVVAHLDALPYNVLSDLEKYLHTVVCHDVSGILIGIPRPPGFGLSVEYWTEPDSREEEALMTSRLTNPQTNLTPCTSCTPGEFAELTSAKTFGSSDTLLITIQPDILKAMTRRAVFDPTLAEKFLPNLRVRYMCGGTSPGVIVWALHEFKKCLADPKPVYGPNAGKGRDLKFKFQTEGNHFIFWDEPEVALQQYIATINL